MKGLTTRVASLWAWLQNGLREHRRRGELKERYPGVHFEWPLIFKIDDYGALTMGTGVSIAAFCEIVVHRRSPHSSILGELNIGDGVGIGAGSNVRAAGGRVKIGRGTQIGQHVSIVASNHLVDASTGASSARRWDEARTGVDIGSDCWIGAGAILLPGISVGDGTIIGAGSVVTKSVPARETWCGNPARPLRAAAGV